MLAEKIRIGLICYKDKREFRLMQWEVLDLSSDITKFTETLQTHQASGGGDTPEDVKGAFQIALDETKITWKSDLKYLILITDAPAHGKKYNNCDRDDFPDEDLQEEIKALCRRNISLITLNIDKDCYKMFNAF